MYRGSNEFGVEAGRITVANQDPGASRARHVVAHGQAAGGGTPFTVGQERQFVEQNPSHFRPQPSQAHQRLQSHQPAGSPQQQRDGRFIAHNRYSSASQALPAHAASTHQPRSIPAPAPPAPPASFQQQQQARLANNSQRQPVPPSFQSPGGGPGVAHLNAPPASSPRAAVAPESYASPNAHNAQMQAYQRHDDGVRQLQARRMSIEQSIAANLPPPAESPRARRDVPSPHDSQHLQQQHQLRMAQSRSSQGLAGRRIDEEEEPFRTNVPVEFRDTPQLNPPIPEDPPRLAGALQHPPAQHTQQGSGATAMTSIFHTYVLDYLQRAGFLTTAAAFLSENPGVFTHPPESGRTYPMPSSSKAPVSSGLPSSSFATQSPTRASPASAPLFRSETGSPESPIQHDETNHSTIESTSSTSTAMSHFGFDRSKSGGMDEEQPSPREGKRRSSTRKDSVQDSIPAADVEHEVENGFLYEWFHVFHDVHSARMKTGGSGPARALVAGSSSATTISSRLRPMPSRQAPGQPQRYAQSNPPNVARPLPPNLPQQQMRAQLGTRRQSVIQLPMGARTDQAAPSQTGSPGQAPPLARQKSLQQLAQLQHDRLRESRGRQLAALERQKLQRIQMEQVEMQNEMLGGSRPKNHPGSSNSGPMPSGVPGYVPDRLATANESFNNYHASLVANQRSQLTQGSPNLEPLSISPQPIPDGSRYVLRDPKPDESPQQPRNENFVKPPLQRTLSHPQASSQDGPMPPPMSFTTSQQGRPPLVRSASTSVVQEDQPTPSFIEELETPTTSTKRRRDSVVSNGGMDVREIKKARSTLDLGGGGEMGQTRTATMIKSPLAVETDFSRSSPPAATFSQGPETFEDINTRTEGVATAQISQHGAHLDDTEALLASLDGGPATNITEMATGDDELDVPTMTDAELDAFFAQSMTTLEDSNPPNAGAGNVPHPLISIPDTADFDFSEYDSFFGSGATSYDPTTYDLRV